MSLTTAELARETGYTEAGIRKLVQRGHIHPLRRGTRPLLFDDTVAAALKQSQWRTQQRAAAGWIGAVCVEFDRLVAAQVRGMSRYAHRA